jgi:F420-dependent oxidoreductase-like protein
MRLGLNIAYSISNGTGGIDLALEADKLGYSSVWTAEAYGSDAITPLAWIGALTKQIKLGSGIMQMPARTPAMTAMTAATLDLLSGGRFLLGLGLSGPQVVEGWHGVPYGKPLQRTREYIELVRLMLSREKPVEYHGQEYHVPIEDGTGLGKPLKLILHPVRPTIPIYLAAIGPKNIELCGELADGWLPFMYSPQRERDYLSTLDAGMAKRSQPATDFDIAATVNIVMGDDVDGCRKWVKPMLALYIGGMGARGKNFYYDLACRYGYEAAANEIQDLYLAGKKLAANDAVPDALVDEVALCGPRERIAELLEPWKKSRVTTLVCGTMQPEVLRTMAELML